MDLVTTGQAAAILGSSRQHVVDLCTSGRLPFQVVGTHRRISRSDVVRLMGGVEVLTRDQQRSLWLHHVVAGKVALDPVRTLALARRNLGHLRSQHPGAVTTDFDEWETLLAGPVDMLLTTLVSPSRRAMELRQNSPFAGVLTERDRAKALAAFRSAARVA